MGRMGGRAAMIAAALMVVACGDDDDGSMGGVDAGRVDASMSLDAATPFDAGDELDAQIDDDDASTVADASSDDAATDDDASTDDASTSDAGTDAYVPTDDAGLTDSARAILALRASSGALASPQYLDTVQITYVLPPFGDDPGGVFVQHELLGPAIFLALDPTTLGDTPVRGAYASFSATETGIVDGQHRVTAIVPGSFQSGDTPVPGFLAEPQDVTAIDVPAELDDLESELTRNRVSVVSDYVDCGLDHWCADITTAGVPTASPATYRFRAVQSVIEAYGLQRRCYQEIELTPLWRFDAQAQTSAWSPDDFADIACPLVRVIGAVALDTTTVAVVFDAPLDPATVAAADFTVTGATVSSVVVSGYVATLTTSAMARGSMHTVSVTGVQDVLGIDITASASAELVVPPATNRPNGAGQIVITEIMVNPSGATETGREWIELANPSTSEPRVLTGCVLRDAAATHTLGALTIPANGRVTLASGADPGFAETYVYSGITLGNSGDSVVIECDGVEIDRVDYDGDFQSRDGYSLSLDPDLRTAFHDDATTSWCTSIAAYAAMDHGTPGAANEECR
ncbi:lamin tail domain-containing protein [Sandaracinus amylolyticus]|uniref:lamin tail domain-containing protein n=1 Tax=Sandaracinus amylolyticus TaxID=927083 RepID=UPI001F295834|nr:lamin tail domain-containing protein [Sandaracinus amylolyticus]UJR78203.1 LTD domain-containing protein [Sandaracinus amylolyticus]